MDDGPYLEPSAASQLFTKPNGVNFSLTRLGKQIIALILAGYGSEGSRQRIGVSQGTVRDHLRSIIAELEVANRLELVRSALPHHLIGPFQICHNLSPVPRPLPSGCHRFRRVLGGPPGTAGVPEVTSEGP
jgi:DNA-binding CsgD family transcriptional regulator